MSPSELDLLLLNQAPNTFWGSGVGRDETKTAATLGSAPVDPPPFLLGTFRGVINSLWLCAECRIDQTAGAGGNRFGAVSALEAPAPWAAQPRVCPASPFVLSPCSLLLPRPVDATGNGFFMKSKGEAWH